MPEIPLTRGLIAIVDSQDYAELSGLNWHATSGGYAATWLPAPLPGMGKDKGRKRIYLHRLIMGLTLDDKRIVTHINKDRVDNRRENLLIVADKGLAYRGYKQGARQALVDSIGLPGCVVTADGYYLDVIGECVASLAEAELIIKLST